MGHAAAKRKRRILKFKANNSIVYRGLLGLFRVTRPLDRAARRRALRFELKRLGA